MLHLAGGNQLLHRPRHLFDRDLGIDPVLVQEVDRLDPQPAEGVLDDVADVFRPAVEAGPARLAVGVGTEAELRGDHDLVPDRRERLAHEFFVGERTVHLGGVEERDPPIDRRAEERDHLRAVLRRAVREAHPHTAEAEGGDVQRALTKFAGLHGNLL